LLIFKKAQKSLYFLNECLHFSSNHSTIPIFAWHPVENFTNHKNLNVQVNSGLYTFVTTKKQNTLEITLVTKQEIL
jgi:hypothetical protein